MPRVVHFEIHADDVERCSNFYKTVFDWQITRWPGPEEYLLVTTGPDNKPGINGGIMKRRDPKGNVYNTIEVDNLDEYTAKIISNGGANVVPKMEIPGVGWLAYFTDTDGNIFGVAQFFPRV